MLAIEAQDVSFGLLQRNVEEAGLADRVEAVPQEALAEPGRLFPPEAREAK